MKFSNLFLAVAMLFSFSTSQAEQSKETDSYATEVAIQTLVRSVVTKKLVN